MAAGMNLGGNIQARAKLFYITSEFKVLVVTILWIVAGLSPAVPESLPPMDFGAAGTITASPATLLVYVLGRCVMKAFTAGSIPMIPDESEVV